MNRRKVLIAAIVVAAIAVVWILVSSAPRWTAAPASTPTAATDPAPAGPQRKINATLYYVSEDGLSLTGIQREIPFGEPIVEQARRIVEAQLAAAPAPYVSAVPAGTSLRALFIGQPSRRVARRAVYHLRHRQRHYRESALYYSRADPD